MFTIQEKTRLNEKEKNDENAKNSLVIYASLAY